MDNVKSPLSGPKNEVIGEFRSTGIRPKCLEDILTLGIPLPDGLFEPKVLKPGKQSDLSLKARIG